MATCIGAHQLQHLLRPPSSSLHFIFKPLCNIATASSTAPPRLRKPPLHTQILLFRPHSSLLNSRLFCNTSSTSSCFVSLQTRPHEDEFAPDNSEDDQPPLQQEPVELETVVDNGELQPIIKSSAELPKLTVKEKKELASYAHSLGKKLKCQQVGKSGVTSSVAASFVETLEANELLKLKVHNSCPGELADVVKQLEQATGSVAVGQIGRSVILYRPSISKLKLEEKKKQNERQRAFIRRGSTLRPTEPKKEQVQRLSGRGHRGSSRH
ncbi:PREDICTED: uncharacterized protein LOC104602022 [Nelumbo nucifera]|uniref:CRM domain-containing protein n=2 Tax=Nelumbo nucifera TaxID=4432 RepID=A0A822ZUG0_NELNU|nr:PREDICTED: uncharacterized protein LOC104602022 [Nelumbo nucifera]DAD46929.1 TPA_asm: hypothetical protein HUJ06_016866 [Nelumbo nucifera]